MKKNAKNFNLSCSIYQILFRNNLLLKIDIKLFIECFFQNLSVYINLYKDEKIKISTEKRNPILFILVCLLFQDEYTDYREIIDNLFSLFIEKLKLFFGTISEYKAIRFLRNFLFQVSKIFGRREYNIENKRYFTILYKYDEKSKFYDRFSELSNKYFYPIIEYIFYHKIKYSNLILSIFFEISSHGANIINLDIETLLNKLYSKSNKYTLLYIKNLKASLSFLFSQIQTSPKIKDFLIRTIQGLNTVLQEDNNNINEYIVIVFSMIYYYVYEAKEKKLIIDETYINFNSFLCDYSSTILSSLLPILVDYKHKTSYYYSFLTFGFYKLLPQAIKNNMCQLYTNFQLTHTNDYIMITSLKFLIDQNPLWNFIYDTIVVVNPNQNNKRKSYCLYSDVQIKHISCRPIRSDVFYPMRYMFSLLVIDYNKVSFYQEKIYHMLYALSNNYNENKALELAIKLYKDMILPYENYIKNNLSDILSINETILKIYVQYVTYPFTNNIIFMTDCQEDEYKENSKIRELIPLYHELKELRENSKKIVRLIYLGLEKKENFIEEEDYLLNNFSAQLFSQFISFHFDDMCYSMIYARLNICYLLIKIILIL